jgi:hypothetical protein
MRAGLAGFARSGKTTLFNALTGLKRGPEAKLHLGSIKVPDPRLDQLSAQFKPRKTTPAEVLLADLPGPRSKARRWNPMRSRPCGRWTLSAWCSGPSPRRRIPCKSCAITTRS